MKLKKILKISGWVMFTISVFILLGFASNRYVELGTQDPIVEIIKPDNHNFITNEKVLDILNDLGYNFQNQKLGDIELQHIEDEIKHVAGVRTAEVYKYNNGQVKIHIEQQLPIARIIFQDGISGCYMDNLGKFIPLSNEYVAKVPVFNGFIFQPTENLTSVDDIVASNDPINSVMMGNIYLLATKINEDEFFKSQIVQVFVNNRNEFELIPRVGNHRILLGNAEDIDSKLFRLKTFYTSDQIDVRELNLYDTLNVKYSNQLVATSKIKN
jgi:cell division protein FtsQ